MLKICNSCKAIIRSDAIEKCPICGFSVSGKERGVPLITVSHKVGSRHRPDICRQHVWSDGKCLVCNFECEHDFEYSSPYHPYNTGQAVRDAKCKICGKVEAQDYGWDDYW